MKPAELGLLFQLVTCTCGEEHYINEPCPRCTAGDYHALEARLEASQARNSFLLRCLGAFEGDEHAAPQG